MKTLRDYQQKAVDAVLNARNRALLVLACATGKTVIAAHIVQRWRQDLDSHPKVLFLCHLVDALHQAKAEFEDAIPGVTTAIFSGTEKGNQNADIVLATFQTFHRGTMEIFDSTEFDFIVVDEAHHALANTYREVIDYFDPNMYVGLTATPDRMDGRDIEDIFGEPVFEYNLAEALTDGRWVSGVDYRVITGELDLAVLRDLAKRAKQGDRRITMADVDRTVFVAEKLQAIIDTVVVEQKKGDKQAVVFCRNLSHLKRVHQVFATRHKGIEVGAYHSQMSAGRLQDMYHAFKQGKIQVLLVVDKFNEAIDIPDTNLLVFLRVTESRTVFEQQLGRGLRKSEHHDKVVVMDFVANCRRMEFISSLMITKGYPKGDGARTTHVPIDLSGHGAIFFEEEGIELLELIQLLQPRDFYKTYEEATRAAQQLGVKTQREYSLRYHEDPRLTSNPRVMYRDDWNGWTYFLTGKHPVELYPSIERAAAAARAMGIRVFHEYKRRYKEDPRLPSNPPKYYADSWKGWGHFLREESNDFYSDLSGAQKAVKKLGIRTAREYQQRYQEDPKLPSAPNKTYSGEWNSWVEFLDQFYRRMSDASAAAGKLGARSRAEYKKLYKQDPKLPSDPPAFYQDEWKGWGHFLRGETTEFYESLAEAQAATRKLGFTSMRQYHKGRKEDPKLPHTPQRMYKDEWVSWQDFLGT